MIVPIVIFLACLGASVTAAARWLPDLAEGQRGGLAFFAVCGLLGAAAGLVGLRIYSIVNSIGEFKSLGNGNGEIVASGLASMLWEAGSLLGLATLVYLLAPAAEAVQEPAGRSHFPNEEPR
jgi:hypothetical protein